MCQIQHAYIMTLWRLISGSTCPQGAVRVSDGTTSNLYGRLEICNNHAWRLVCADLWDNVDAQVACRQLGLPSAGKLS